MMFPEFSFDSLVDFAAWCDDNIKVTHALLGVLLVWFFYRITPPVCRVVHKVFAWFGRKCAYFFGSFFALLWGCITYVPLLVFGRLCLWWYTIPTRNSLLTLIPSSGLRFTPAGLPFIQVSIDGVLRNIAIDANLAMFVKPQVGKEAAIAGSHMDAVATPKGIFSFFNKDRFIGCGFRMAFGRSVYLVTARHVYEEFGDEVYLKYGNRTLKFKPEVVARGNVTDFVLFKDSFLVSQVCKSFASAKYSSRGTVRIVGTSDSHAWMSSSGTTGRSNTVFQFTHKASTQPGWSGSPVFNKDGKVVGVHTGSTFTDGVVVNEATAIVDILMFMHRKTKTALVTKESFEEYDDDEWKEQQAVDRAAYDDYYRKNVDDFYFHDNHLVVKLSKRGFNVDLLDTDLQYVAGAWADSAEPMDYSAVPVFPESATQGFPPGPLVSAHGLLDNSMRSATTTSVQSPMTTFVQTPLGYLNFAGEVTLPTPLTSLDPLVTSTNTFQNSHTSIGQNAAKPASSSHWATTVASSNKNVTDQVRATWMKPLEKLSRKSKKVLKDTLIENLGQYPESLLASASLPALVTLLTASKQ